MEDFVVEGLNILEDLGFLILIYIHKSIWKTFQTVRNSVVRSIILIYFYVLWKNDLSPPLIHIIIFLSEQDNNYLLFVKHLSFLTQINKRSINERALGRYTSLHIT